MGSLDLRSSRALILCNIYTGTGSVLIRCRPEGICCDAAFRVMVRNIFSPFWLFVGSRLLLSLSSISLRYRSQFAFFKLKLVRWRIRLIVKSICKLMRIGRRAEPIFVFVCQLVEMIREYDANGTSGGDGLALPGSLVGESQLRIPKLEPYIIFSNMVPLVSIELEYHAEWCAMKSPSIRVSLLFTHSHDPCWWVESDVPACGPPASFSVHLASSAVTPVGSVHKSRGDNVVRMWVQLKR